MFDIFKKKSSEKKGCDNNNCEKKLSESEIEQLKQELKEKKEDVRSLYNKLIEAGGTELPDDMLEAVAGGRLTVPTVMRDDCRNTDPTLIVPTPIPTGGDRAPQ